MVEKERLNIEFSASVQKVHRNKTNVELEFKVAPNGFTKTETCDFLIWTPPMPEFVKRTSDLRNEERVLFKTLSPHIFVSTLTRQNGTIRNRPYAIYAESLEKKIEGGVMAELDIEGELKYCDEGCALKNDQYDEMKDSSRITTSLQLRKTKIGELESNKMLKSHYENGFNTSSLEFLNTITWEYFYKWSPTELSTGNHWRVFNIQGLHRTWYAGASVSFESVKSVMEYNNLLLKQSNS